jgi:hypothetical protein
VRASINGGGIYCQSHALEIDGCCFNDVSTTGVSALGHVLHSDRDNSTLTMASSSLVDCGDEASSARGTLFIDKNPAFSLVYLNFSGCQLPSNAASGDDAIGFIFWAYVHSRHPWYLRYCTVVDCSGSSGIHHTSSSVGTIEYCNFYDNVARSDRAVLSTWGSGQILRFCIFDGNSREMMLSGGGRKFSMTDCVLSCPAGSLPSDYFDDLSSGNFFGTTTESLAITPLETENCRTPWPAKTPAETRDVGVSLM